MNILTQSLIYIVFVIWLSACSNMVKDISGPSVMHKSLASTNPANSLSNIVSITGGAIQGNLRNEGLREYLGIPFASPPTDERRWQPPLPVDPWQGIRDATQKGLPCVQPASLSEFYDRSYVETSEDCLTLNVWTRADQTTEGLPVMVWIHGGALVMGSGRDYDGAALTDKGVVLVTINYRLGPFGFFAHPELTAESSDGSSGNQGFRDQIAALNWVRDNIARFGGDPANVTIFGESAGSWSMSVLQASPMARGLFHKIIGQSGARFIPLPDLSDARWGIPSAEDWGLQIADKLDAGSVDLASLRMLPAETIMDAYVKDPEILNNFDRLTIVDGVVLPDEVNTIFAAGQQADVPVLIGSNADEATTFFPSPESSGEAVDHVTPYKLFIESALPTVSEQIFAHYPATPDRARDSLIRLNTDTMFTQPMRLWANYMDHVSSPAYLYWWDWRPMINGSDKFGAFHAAEIPYVFGNLAMFEIKDSAEERAFAETMMTIWTNFAKTGSPSIAGVLNWGPYSNAKPSTAVLGREIRLMEGIRTTEVQLITDAYNKMRE